MNNLTLIELTPEEKEKTSLQLKFINLFVSVAKSVRCRAVLAGGFAIDGALGQITRFHNDMDIHLYCTKEDGLAVVMTILNTISELEPDFAVFNIEDKAQTDYYRNLYVRVGSVIADIYYLRTQNDPFEQEKVVIQRDGTVTESHVYNIETFTLDGVSFEGQDALTEIIEKIVKRDIKGYEKREKDLQDIVNLQTIVSKEDIDRKLSQITK